MIASVLKSVVAMQFDREGTMSVVFDDGRVARGSLGRPGFEASSAIASSLYLPATSRLVLQTVRGDHIALEVPAPSELAPREERPAIYLDQNHWSTLTNTIHEPARVANSDERDAAERLVGMVLAREVLLPLSAAHVSETCKQVDLGQRYRRGLTMAQLPPAGSYGIRWH